MPLLRMLAGLVLAAALSATAHASENEVRTALHMLDYIGVDYAGAVQDGRIISEAEYREQQEFAAEVARTLDKLKVDPAVSQQAVELQRRIDRRAPTAEIQAATRELSQALLRNFPIATSPKRAPDVAAAVAMYQQQCASCHGPSGAGDGIAGKGMDPAPANFLDRERQRQRSVFALYNTLNTGVAGTGMPGFAHLPEPDRWALAFYVSQLAFTDAERQEGRRLVEGSDEAAAALPTLGALTDADPSALVERFGPRGEAVLAYLRQHPEVLGAKADALGIAVEKLRASVDAYAAGRLDEASQSAISAYLDGFELAEAQLTTADADLTLRIETSMMDFRGLIKARAPIDEVKVAEGRIEELLAQARERMEGGGHDAVGSFLGSFVILTREGLEAILVLAAMFAFLRKTDRRDALPYVHGGWIAALLLGIATWAVSTYFITISGAGRELTEGITALLAAAILVSVGLWLHNKSYSNRWQQYVAATMRGALSKGRPWGLTLLAFVAVYREVFETVLFYRALWGQGDHTAILLGVAAGATVLLALTWAIFAISMRLPIREFFGWSSALIVLIAVIFAGKGIAALQEAGTIATQPVTFVRVPALGIYPNAQGLALQGAVLLLVLAGLAWNHFRARQAAAT
jgi:high-affinity iron transporter